jgi:hypothetical protein
MRLCPRGDVYPDVSMCFQVFPRWRSAEPVRYSPAMRKHFASPLLALPLALALACGAAHAQMKPPSKTQPKDALGSGIGSQSLPSTPAPAAGAAAAPAAGDDKSSAEAVVQEIANCVLAGLPPDWTLAQIEVREIGRSDKQRDFEANYSFKDGAGKAGAFVPCDPREPALNVYKLNGALDPAKRNWVRATLVLSKEGKFELQYDYAGAEGKASAKPSAEPKTDAKKSAAKDAKKN